MYDYQTNARKIAPAIFKTPREEFTALLGHYWNNRNDKLPRDKRLPVKGIIRISWSKQVIQRKFFRMDLPFFIVQRKFQTDSEEH